MKQRIYSVIVLFMAGLLITESAMTHQASNPATSYRRHIMKAASHHVKALHALLDPTHLAPFSAQAALHISALQAIFRALPELFPKQGNYLDSDARPTIWRQWSQFTALIDASEQDLLTMQQATDLQQRFQALQQLHNRCRDCHDTYRD